MPRHWSNIILTVPVRMFLDKINIKIDSMNREYSLPQLCVGLIQSLESLIRMKRLKFSQVKDSSFSAFNWKQLLLLDLDLPVLRLEPYPWFPGSQASGFGLKLYHSFSWSLACTITLKI